jgi:hypothetical protein
MPTKQFNFLSRTLSGAKVDTTKGHLIFLILLTAFGASGLYTLSELGTNPLWDSSWRSPLLNDHISDTVAQQIYLIPENEDSYGLHSKDSPEQSSTLVSDFLNFSTLKSGSETPLKSINSFHYVLNYGYSPLRSPPIFS